MERDWVQNSVQRKRRGIDVIEVLVNAMHSGLPFNLMDISIFVIYFKIRSNPMVGRSTECIAFTKTSIRSIRCTHYLQGAMF